MRFGLVRWLVKRENPSIRCTYCFVFFFFSFLFIFLLLIACFSSLLVAFALRPLRLLPLVLELPYPTLLEASVNFSCCLKKKQSKTKKKINEKKINEKLLLLPFPHMVFISFGPGAILATGAGAGDGGLLLLSFFTFSMNEFHVVVLRLVSALICQER